MVHKQSQEGRRGSEKGETEMSIEPKLLDAATLEGIRAVVALEPRRLSRESIKALLAHSEAQRLQLTAQAEALEAADARNIEMARDYAQLDKELLNACYRAEEAEERATNIEAMFREIVERDPDYFRRLVDDDADTSEQVSNVAYREARSAVDAYRERG